MVQLQSDSVRRTTALILLLSAITFLAGLGRPAIGDSDEAFYAEAGREMVASGDWLTPYYNYELRFQKPILFYWLVAGTYAVAGVSEAGARLWSALAGVGLALLTAAIGRAWYDERTARLGGLVVATAFGYFSIGRLSLPDLPLAFFITLATWTAIRGLVDPVGRPISWLAASGLALGFGFLTKGPVGVLIPGLVVAPIAWVERRRLTLTVKGLALAAALALGIGVPWYAAMASVHGPAYLDSFFVGDNVERFATARFNEPRPLWFYLPIVLGGLMPWTPLLACAAPPLRRWIARRARPGAASVRLMLWAALPLLFFTASVGKQPRYILPILPPLALLLARAVQARLQAGAPAEDAARQERPGSGVRRRGGDRLIQGATLTIGILLVVLSVLIYRAMPLVIMVDPSLVAASAALILVSGAGVAAAALLVADRHLPLAVALAAALTLLGLQYGLSPAGRDPVQNMSALVLKHRTGDEPLATFRVFVRNLIFYTHVQRDDLPNEEAVRAFLRRPERVLLVITADDLPKVTGDGLEVRTLDDVLYFNASAVKLRTLLSPDPERDLERVLLVTNR